jgi:hypothetical protein
LRALAGVALCAVAFVSRAASTWNLGPYNIAAILQAGLAGMLLACSPTSRISPSDDSGAVYERARDARATDIRQRASASS